MDCRTERKLSLLKETNFWLQFSVSQIPLVLGLGLRGLGLRVWGQGLTI